jgi:hypothetical protein
LVSDGSYSDHSIEGIFDNREKAEKFKDYYQFDHLEEFPLNPEAPAAPDGDQYCLQYEIATGVGEVERISNDYHDTSEDWEEFSYGVKKESPIRVRCTFFARDAEHARKITGDRLTALKAGATTFTCESRIRQCGEGEDTVLSSHSYWAVLKRTWRLDGKTSTLLYTEVINEKDNS